MHGRHGRATYLTAMVLLCAQAVSAQGFGARPTEAGASQVAGTSLRNRVQLDCRLLGYGREITTPIGENPVDALVCGEEGGLSAWIARTPAARAALQGTIFLLQSQPKTLAAPTVTLEFGQEGHIEVATQIDYVRGYKHAEDGRMEPTIATVVDAVHLRMTPLESSDDGHVVIRFDSEFAQTDLSRELSAEPVVYLDRPGGRRVRTGITQPAVSRRSIETTCRAADRTLVMPGGVASMESRRCRTGIPVLRSIPLVGRIFGGTAITHTTRGFSRVVRPSMFGLPGEPRGAQFEGGREVVVRLRIVRFVVDKGSALPPELARLPDDWQLVGRRLKAPDILVGDALPVAQRLLTAASGVVSQREVILIALEGAPFEARDEVEHTYLNSFTFDEEGRPLPDVEELTAGISLAGTARVQDDGRIAVNAEFRVARLDGYREQRFQVPSRKPDGTPGPPHRLQVDVPSFAAADLTIDEDLAPGETCILSVHGTPRGSAVPQVSVYMLTADILDEAQAE